MNRYVILIRTLNKKKRNILDLNELKEEMIFEKFEDIKFIGIDGTIIANSDLDEIEIKMLIEDILYEEFNIDTRCRVILQEELKNSIDEEYFIEYVGERVFVSLIDESYVYQEDYLSDDENILILKVFKNFVICCAKIINNKVADTNYFLEDISKTGTITRSINIIKKAIES